MVDRSRSSAFFAHAVLIGGLLAIFFPLFVTLVASTHELRDIAAAPMPLAFGRDAVENYEKALFEGSLSLGVPVWRMMMTSFAMAIVIAVGKIAISILSAYAIVYFRFPLRMVSFWLIFITLMLPVEVRIIPTYKVVSDLGMLDSIGGLTIPLIASATATFLFRQFFMTIPDELVEAARIDGAGPMRFFWDVVLPLSRTNIAALFVILFIYGWNQYLWPLLVINSKDMDTILIGLYRMLTVNEAQIEWHVVMATAVLAMIPPLIVIVAMQRWFVKGLVETEK
ncbi:MAG TPA: sn-glycerol-3-phosphate ABC transporter permease UgpE [Alphaproteobacteria bacterium]|nr:sn-glycerol-3-phosphate ABC transporter permease UgpE [Alphaproteobacteria bacterium]